MGVWRAFTDGMRRVNRAPAVLFGFTLLTVLVALPFAVSAGGGLLDGPAARVDTADAAGVGRTGAPGTPALSLPDAHAPVEHVTRLLRNRPLDAAVAWATAAWLVLASFLSGGIIDRYARQRPTRAFGFFGACGVHFWRFLRLGALALAVYAALFGLFHPFAIAPLLEGGGLPAGAGYLAFGAPLAAAIVLFEYARIRIVVEDRRSALGAVVAAARFVLRHPWAVLGVFLLNAGAWLLLMLVYTALSAGAGESDTPLWVLMLSGQGYLLGRHYLKLLVYASGTALFQGALAHATYAAAPVLTWPDSPAVETITNADPAGLR